MLELMSQQLAELIKVPQPCVLFSQHNCPQKITIPLMCVQYDYAYAPNIKQWYDYSIALWKKEARGKARLAQRGVCAWLLTPLSTLHHAILTTQLAPFTFSIGLLCQLSIYNSSNY